MDPHPFGQQHKRQTHAGNNQQQGQENVTPTLPRQQIPGRVQDGEMRMMKRGKMGIEQLGTGDRRLF
ncbi:MAG: hypothetical protein H6658_18625 [Ardenticatenaceae bacterium]|nr:hypothetical protein [Ardenticatenaceae bacterium]